MVQNKDTEEQEEERESVYLYIPAIVFALWIVVILIYMFFK